MRFVLSILFGLVCCISFSQSPKDQKKIEKYILAGDYKAAEAVTDKMISVNDGNINAFYIRSEIRKLLGDYKGAVKDLSKVQKLLDEPSDKIYSSIAFLELEQNNTQSALSSINKALDISAKSETYWYQKGEILSDLGQYKESNECLDKAKSFAKDLTDEMSAALKANFGKNYFHLNDITTASRYLTEAIQLQKYNYTARLYRGYVNHRLGKWEAAERDFKISLQASPFAVQTYNSLAEMYIEMDSLDLAILYASRGARSDEKNASVHLSLTTAYAKQGLFEKAYEHLEEYANLDTIGLLYHITKTELVFEEQNEVAFDKQVEILINDFSDKDKNALEIARLFMRCKKDEQALKMLEVAEKQDSNNIYVYHNQANILMDQKKYDEAIRALEKVVERSSKDVAALNNIGLMYWYKKMPQEAIEYYEKAIVYDEDFSYSYNNLGNAYYDLGKESKACSYWKKALSKGYEYQNEWQEKYGIEDPNKLIQLYCSEEK